MTPPLAGFTLPRALAERTELAPLAWALAGRPQSDPRRSAYRNVLAWNLLLGSALDEILGAFDRAGIAAQPLKGALFVETLYGGDPGLRPMSDLDLLCAPSDLERAHQALLACKLVPFGLDEPRWSPRFTHHRIYKKGPLTVELHWKLCHELGVRAEADDFLRDTETIPFRGRTVAIARPALQIYFILLHAATHGLLHSPIWVVDAALQVRCSPPLEWDALLRYAAEHKASRLLAAAARYVNLHFPGTFPEVATPTGLRERLLETFLQPGRGVASGPTLASLGLRALLVDDTTDLLRLLYEKMLLRGLELRHRAKRADVAS